ncbi:MAG: hypothetical protein ACRDD4_06155 [Culicoidibacterales bacterium]
MKLNHERYYITYGELFVEEALKGTWTLKDSIMNTCTWYNTFEEACNKFKLLHSTLGFCTENGQQLLKIVKVTTEVVGCGEE